MFSTKSFTKVKTNTAQNVNEPELSQKLFASFWLATPAITGMNLNILWPYTYYI